MVAPHSQSDYPSVGSDTCGSWTLVDNVCCPSYCSNVDTSESCSLSCTGSCVTPPSADCKSGTMFDEVHHVSDDEVWHYSVSIDSCRGCVCLDTDFLQRSTHFGLTSGGACGFGMYGLCTKGSSTASWTDSMLGSTCDAFCKAYPILCKDPTNITLRGNFAAPNGDYYTQVSGV